MREVGRHVLTLEAVLSFGHRASGEADLIQVQDPITVVSRPGEQALHRGILLLLFFWVSVPGLLEPLQRPLLHLVLLVDLP